MKRIILELAVTLAVFSAFMTSCDASKTFRYASGATWGTVYHIKYLSDIDLSDSILSVMKQVDMSLSPYQKGSQVSRLNSGELVKADKMLSEVFAISQHVCSISSGSFDPTVAPLVNLWGFGYHAGAEDRPSTEQIDSALITVGILDCYITPDGYVKGKHPKTEYDFSAIAKGYGVDMLAAMLLRNGCNNYMVEVGGEMALRGNGPSGDGWVIQVDAPVPEGDDGVVRHEALTTLKLTDICVATSGNYRNHRQTSQGEVGHTISPITGMPVRTEVLSATILAPTAALADALATAAMALPLHEASEMIQSQKSVEALLVVEDGKSFRTIEVPKRKKSI